jgi:hypothetical protein
MSSGVFVGRAVEELIKNTLEKAEHVWCISGSFYDSRHLEHDL